MLKVNKETMREAERVSGLSTRAFAERLGVSLSTYVQKVAENPSAVNITLKDILIAQDLSAIPIEKFFTHGGEEITHHD